MTTRGRALVHRLEDGGAQEFLVAKKFNKMWNSLLLFYFLDQTGVKPPFDKIVLIKTGFFHSVLHLFLLFPV